MNELYNIDCMEFMKDKPDKFYDLAIVDPPYGIGASKESFAIKGKVKEYYRKSDWDTNIPEKSYFLELFRVSENQIIWGANYMVEHLPPSMGWIYWDKMNGAFSLSDGELAFSSFNKALRSFKKNVNSEKGGRIHPTQKPVALYKWLLKNYAKEGDKLLDTHSGSGSFRIAAYDMGFDLDSCELDKDYFEANEKRYQEHVRLDKMQIKLF